MNTFALALLLVSAIAWTIVYVLCIKIGFKEKTYCMPLWALGLNVWWEIIYALNGIPHPTVQAAANAIWACCDLLIVVTYFKFGKAQFPSDIRSKFTAYSILAFATCLVVQLAFFLYCDSYVQAAQYSAFAQNVVMSILFVVMLFQRKSSLGQSMAIAVAKWLGTLAPTLQQGIVQEFNIYILLMGLLCSVWDLTYIFLLHRQIHKERSQGALSEAASGHAGGTIAAISGNGVER